MAELIPFKEDGDRITCAPSADVVGCRCVSISGNENADGIPQVAQTGAGGKVLGIAAWDAVVGTRVTVVTPESGHIVPVIAGAANLAAGASVMSDAAGKAIVAAGASGAVIPCFGIVVTGAVAGAQTKIKLARHVVVIP